MLRIIHDCPLTGTIRFRLVSLNIEAILREPTIYERRERLSQMSRLDVGYAYGGTIERIKAQDVGKSRLGMAALMWVIHAERQLRADELCQALAVKIGSEDFNAGNAPSIWTLASCCQGLIAVDKHTSTVKLVHPTVKEYLSTRSDIFNRPHSTIAEICLTYLNSTQVKAMPANRSTNTRDTPFLEYCSLYWGVHARRDISSNLYSLALQLCRARDHISSKFLLEHVKYLDGGGSASIFGSVLGGDIRCHFGESHWAPSFGIVELVSTVLYGSNGHKQVVDMLVREGTWANERDSSGLTPLLYAVCCGNERVVGILLSHQQIDADMPDCHGKTPLSYAAQDGLGGVVARLLERRGVDPNKHDDSGNTPLSFAARGGHDGVVKILLRRVVDNADEPDNDGKTPLSYAASGGHEEVVKLLLWWTVNPDQPDHDGRTPLMCAASGGHTGVVKTLLGRKDVNTDKPDKDGRTPLMCAASGGHAEVVKILLGREEVNSDKPDNQGQTPLMLATRLGFQDVITVLQSHQAETPAQPEA